MVQAASQGGSAALGGIVGYGSDIACQRPEGIHPLAHPHKGCIIGQCLHASVMHGHPCMQTDQTMSLKCRCSTYHLCMLMLLAVTDNLPYIACGAYAWQICCYLPCTYYSIGLPVKMAWAAVVQDGQTHTGRQIQLSSSSSSGH